MNAPPKKKKKTEMAKKLKPVQENHYTMVTLQWFLFLEREFQLMAFAPDDNSLSSDQNTN